MVNECVQASQRVEAGGSPYLRNADSKVRFEQEPPEPPPRTAPTRSGCKVSKLSFEDYHRTWSGIATSKTHGQAVNPLLENIKDDRALQQVHLGLPREEVEEQMRRQMEDHNTLMYGRFKSKQTAQEAKEAKLSQLQKMKRIYLAPRQSPMATPAPPGSQDIHLMGLASLPTTSRGKAAPEEDKEAWEREADDLVNWTNNLDAAAIDAT